jgi:hypothetical protein
LIGFDERLWTTHELSGPAGVKFDLVHLLDGATLTIDLTKTML